MKMSFVHQADNLNSLSLTTYYNPVGSSSSRRKAAFKTNKTRFLTRQNKYRYRLLISIGEYFFFFLFLHICVQKIYLIIVMLYFYAHIT